MIIRQTFPLLLCLAFLAQFAGIAAQLPPGVRAEWDMERAFREETPSRERICVNGLWRWKPANDAILPSTNWGFFKVPGAWPGITDYLQKDSQNVYRDESWRDTKLGEINAAWYQREIRIPANWAGRRIVLSTEYLNSFAVAYLDGQRVGEMRFPAGELDLTDACRPGERQLLTLLVTAMPLKGVLLSYTDSASARQVKGAVARRGLCGDVFLEGIKNQPRIMDVQVEPSFRRKELTIRAALNDLKPHTLYKLQARVSKASETNELIVDKASPQFTAEELTNGQFTLSTPFPANFLWDIHTPTNQLDLTLTLRASSGDSIDRSAPVRFGFRELWIDGRDFYLNGSRIFLSAVPLDNAQIGAAWSTYAAARETLERLKSFGINFVYTHNYGCEPGSHLSFDEILRAADDAGILVALSQPHFSHYEWKSPDADRTNGYATHAAFYAKVAGNHPSVVFYAMSHNATGYSEDMNPDMIDGIQAPRDQWASRNAALALRAEAIVRGLDPSRIVYHHASGNLGSMHPMNFYPNFVPIQELSDWFGNWATNGVKPAFMCEYGAPFTWDWTMYRGWYKGQREFGSARVPWEFCVAEWNTQFLGDRAYAISQPEKADLRWEAKQFRAGNLWHRWDYPFPVGSDRFDEQYPIFARYLTDNWRAFRGWGVSAISPWEYEHFWKLRPGVKRERKDFGVDFANLQRPGYSPDYAEPYDRMDLGFERNDWIATPAAEALLRNNRPLLGFIAGKPDAFTSKDHNFHPGERIEKQIIVINNSRDSVRGSAVWSFDLETPAKGQIAFEVRPGEQKRLPISFELPGEFTRGSYKLRARIEFNGQEVQEDEFEINVVPRTPPVEAHKRIALFDPKGETEAWLKRAGIQFKNIGENADLSNYDVLIVGKQALTVDGAAPDISRVRDGLCVVLFEQSSAVLEKRFGFRVEEYGLRQIFARIPDHPVLSGMLLEYFHDWRGQATLLPPRLSYEMRPRYGPTVQWCDIPVTRVWRCGNQGNVASVLIEKPPGGDFLPILEGGYALQYSPLLEHLEGRGMMLFCQLDLTGRSESDPAAETLAANILRYACDWKPAPRREVLYSGSSEGKEFLQQLRVPFKAVESATPLRPDDLLVLAPGDSSTLPFRTNEIRQWVESGGHVLALGLSGAELNRFLPAKVNTTKREHISSFFPAPRMASPFAGVAPADLHNHDPREFELIDNGAQTFGDGVIASSSDGRIVLFQMAPWEFKGPAENLRRTYRRVSFALARVLANLGAESSNSVLAHFHEPPKLASEKRWLDGLYLDTPEEWDDPYRFFRW